MTRIFGRNLSTLPRTGYPRSGSVLILVIVLLLLLAILGTAYLTTSAGDRSASAQTVINAQVDENSKAIANAVTGMIVNDMTDFAGLDTNNSGGFIFGQPKSVDGTLYYPTFEGITNYQYTYRGAYSATQNYFLGDVVSYPVTPNVQPYYWLCINTASAITPAPPTVNASYPPTPASANWRLISPPNVTSGWTTNWLADRIPVPDGSGTPYWQNITQLFVPGTLITNGNSNAVFNNLPFESPDGVPWTAPALWTSNSYADHPAQGFYPGFKALNGTLVPTLGIGGTSNVIAADADGDGIADSYLFRIPGATFDNLTWYAGVRIIDDNSAINANTAVSRTNSYDAGSYSASYPNYGLTPANVGLSEILSTPPPAAPSIPALTTNFQFSAMPSPTGIANAYDETLLGGVVSPVQRTDFSFKLLEDAAYMTAGRRLINPGFINNTSLRARIFPFSDTASLAYHFVEKNPALIATGYPTALEGVLFNDLYNNIYIPTAPYDGVSQARTLRDWFGVNGALSPVNYGNFNGGGQLPEIGSSTPPAINGPSLRPYLVTHNAVSNYITPVYDNLPSTIALSFNPNGQPAVTGGITGDPLYTTPMTTGTPDPLGQMMLPYGPYNVVTAAGTSSFTHYRGIWNSTFPYYYNDIVLDNGYTYICVNTPGTQVPIGAAPTATNPGQYEPASLNISTNSYYNATLPVGGLVNGQYWQLQPWSQQPTKANVNTATFRELFRAYWSVMSGNPVRSATAYAGGTAFPPLSPFGDIGAYPYPYDWSGAAIAGQLSNPDHMFRTVLRDPTLTTNTAVSTTFMYPGDVAILRAAIAAVNTMALRDNSQTVISRTVGLTAVVNGTPSTVYARVYSNDPQPFITEVYANNYNGAPLADTNYSTAGNHVNQFGYIAVELYNPYPFPLVLNNWQVGMINRSSSGSLYPSLTLQSVAPIPSFSIPAYGYALLENFGNSTPGTTGDPGCNYRPSDTGLDNSFPPNNVPLVPTTVWSMWNGVPAAGTATAIDVPINGLQNIFANGGEEMVLLRPRRADGVVTTVTAAQDPLNAYNENNINDLVPVDSYDFTGLPAPVSPPSNAQGYAWSYIRPKGLANLFKQTYPGRYLAAASQTVARLTAETQAVTINSVTSEPVFTSPQTPSFGVDDALPNYNTFQPIQIYNVGLGANAYSHFPNPVVAPTVASAANTPGSPNYAGKPTVLAAPHQFPFGGFARNGDILDVPFIGAYRITAFTPTDSSPANFLELNSLPMDCSFADDGDNYASADPNDLTYFHYRESVGRFCGPLSAQILPSPAAPTLPPNPPSGIGNPYFWTSRLFNYLTAQNNNDNYFPNFDPGFNELANVLAAAPATNLPATKYPYTVAPTGPLYPEYPAGIASQIPTQVYNSDGTLTDQTTQHANGVEGLININTASAQVLNMLPLVPGNAGQNFTLAQQIVTDRNTNGPFASIFDLNRVMGFQAAAASSPLTASAADGLLTPPPPNFPSAAGATGRNILEDYQSDFAELTRISNLITTRSDTFTVYIVVEGWQNAVFPGMSAPAGYPPALKVVHRYSFILDRSAISGATGSITPQTIIVPND